MQLSNKIITIIIRTFFQFFIKLPVFYHFFNDFFCCITSSYGFLPLCITFFPALQALCTYFPVNGKIPAYGTGRTDIPAVTTAGTAQRKTGNLRFFSLAFRICTPETFQRTALQKHCCPDSRAVMDRQLLNIKYDPGLHLFTPLSTRCFCVPYGL